MFLSDDENRDLTSMGLTVVCPRLLRARPGFQRTWVPLSGLQRGGLFPPVSFTTCACLFTHLQFTSFALATEILCRVNQRAPGRPSGRGTARLATCPCEGIAHAQEEQRQGPDPVSTPPRAAQVRAGSAPRATLTCRLGW